MQHRTRLKFLSKEKLGKRKEQHSDRPICSMLLIWLSLSKIELTVKAVGVNAHQGKAPERSGAAMSPGV